MIISDCCAAPTIHDDDRDICTSCGEPCQAYDDSEETEPYRSHGITERERASMREDANGDRFIND